MNVRIPVRVARGICCLSSKGALSQLLDLSSRLRGESFDRQEYHKRVEKTERINLRPLLYSVSLEPQSWTALKATTILSTSGDEEGAKRSHCRHRKSNVSCYELPVGPQDGVDRFDCAAGVHAGNTDYSAHNGEDGEARSRKEGKLLSPPDFDRPDKLARNDNNCF